VISRTRDFLDLSADNLEEFIRDSNLQVNDEKVVFDAIIRWIQHDLANRNQSLEVLLHCVRFGLLSNADFNSVKEHALVNNDAAAICPLPRLALALQTYSRYENRTPS